MDMISNELNKRIRGVQDSFLLMKNDRERQLKKLDALEKEREVTIKNIDARVEAINFIEGVASQERIAVSIVWRFWRIPILNCLSVLILWRSSSAA
jgi:hypothetical protein